MRRHQVRRNREDRRFLLQLPQYGWLPKIANVQVQTHSRCNADCVFCPYVESAHAAEPGRMTDATWEKIITNLIPFRETINGGKFCPYLMNEPLLDRTIYAKIEEVYREFPTTCVEVSTNGAALMEKAVEQLLSAMDGHRHDIWVSHQGIDRDSMQYIMRIDYDRATANLLHLLRVADGQFTIRIRGTGESQDGQHKYFTRDDYLAYWKRMFHEHHINDGGGKVTVDAFKFHDRAGTLHRLDRGANELKTNFRRQIDPAHPFYCPRVDQWVHFLWDGTIRLCCMDYHGEVKLPNINEVSLLDYFHGEEYTELVETVSGRKPCDPNYICARCQSPGG